MIGLLLLYFIVKPFYSLAQQHGKNKWLFSVLALLIYYGASILVGALTYTAIMLLGTPNIIAKFLAADDKVWAVVLIPFGLLAIWVVHALLKKRFEKQENTANPYILDENL